MERVCTTPTRARGARSCYCTATASVGMTTRPAAWLSALSGRTESSSSTDRATVWLLFPHCAPRCSPGHAADHAYPRRYPRLYHCAAVRLAHNAPCEARDVRTQSGDGTFQARVLDGYGRAAMADPRELLGRRCYGPGREQAEPTVWQPLDTRCH